MYIWSNDGYTDNCIHYIGNGRMLIESSGPNIRTILGSRYTSLPFLSAVIDENTQRLTSLTQFENGIWQHKLTYSDNPANSFTGSAYFIHFTDHMDRKHNLFVRRFHAINPLSFKLIIPLYVKVYYDQSYRLSGNTYVAAVIFTIQETTVPYLLNYCKLFLIMNGNTEFDQENNRIYCKSGDGSIIIAVGEEEKDIQDAGFILNRYNQSLNHTVLFYSKYINRFHGRSHEDKYVVRALKLLESVSVFLLHMQSIDGGMVKSRSQPYADISVQYYCLRAFLAFGCPLQAKKILDFIMKKFILHNDINAFECVGGDIYRQSAGAGYAATPAYCILMVFEYFKFSGDKDYLVTLLPMLKYAVRIQIKNACGDLMVSDGCESAILNGYITNKVTYADSMRNTLLYIESLKAMLYIIDALSCKIINRAVIDKAVQRSIIAFSETFIDNGFRSYAGRSRKTHRERFRYGICDSCGDKVYPRIIAFLERCDDEYLCRSCYNKIPFLITETDPSVFDKTIISDILLIPYLNSNIVDIKAVVKFIETYKNKETNFLPVIIGSDKYIHSDTGMFLYILAESGNTNSELLYKSLIDASCINDLWNEHKGSGEYTVYTNAICAEALMKYLKNTNIL